MTYSYWVSNNPDRSMLSHVSGVTNIYTNKPTTRSFIGNSKTYQDSNSMLKEIEEPDQ